RKQLVESIALARPHSEWKAGATVNDVSLTSDLQGGFSGLYTFRSLDDFAAGRPAVWRQAFGVPRTRFGATSFGAFLQNQWRAVSRAARKLGSPFQAWP